MARIKLIWDFRNKDAEQIATHHVKHLEEYLSTKKIENSNAGVEMISEDHWIGFIETDKSRMIELRDALKPQRGQLI